MNNSSSSRSWNRRFIPSLSSLLMFKSAALHLSFYKAAIELGRTPSAVSRSIRELEKRLGCTLFQRDGRNVLLTKTGMFYLSEVSKALNVLEEGDRVLSREEEGNIILLRAPPTFASTFLIPNLSDFHNNFPNIGINLSVDQNYVDWSQQNVDVEIRLCGVENDSLFVKTLGALKVVPVCSPQIISTGRASITLEEAGKFSFLQLNDKKHFWDKLLRTTGHEGLKIESSFSFNNTQAMLEAVRNGLGFGIGLYPLISTYPGYGEDIILPFKLDISTELTYIFVCRKTSIDNPEIVKFLRWLEFIFNRLMEKHLL